MKYKGYLINLFEQNKPWAAIDVAISSFMNSNVVILR